MTINNLDDGDITANFPKAKTQLDVNSNIVFSIGNGEWYDVTNMSTSIVPPPFVRVSESYHSLLKRQNIDDTWAIAYDGDLGYPICKPKYSIYELEDFKNYIKSNIAASFMKAKQKPLEFNGNVWSLSEASVKDLTNLYTQLFISNSIDKGATGILIDADNNAHTFTFEDIYALMKAYTEYNNEINLKNSNIIKYINNATTNHSIKDLTWDTYNEKLYPTT